MINSLMTGEELTRRLSALLKSAHHIRVVTAYMTDGAIVWFGRYVQHERLMIVGRFSLQDFVSGASSISAVQSALSRGYCVSMLPQLHSKIYEIDSRYIFSGSANFTAKGLALCSTPNFETAVEIPYTEESSKFIDKYFNAATPITPALLAKMESILAESISSGRKLEELTDWPDEFYAYSGELFICDMPLSSPSNPGQHVLPDATHGDFALINKNLHLPDVAYSLFSRCKVIRWLNSQFKMCDDESVGLSFGELTSRLHSALANDPSPYRRDVKNILSNLYEYINLLARDEYEIYIPGRHSQFIRRVFNGK